MSKTITINNGGRYDDKSYTDERHYHYEGGKRETAEAETESAETARGKERKVLTINQQVLLFSTMLGASLDSSFNNNSMLAEIISKVSGWDSNSVRNQIMKLNKMDSYSAQVRKDAEIVAKLIEDYKPQLANELRITYIDD